MARTKAPEISLELRQKLYDDRNTFTTFTLATIPNGRDPRRLSINDTFPQVVIHINSTIVVPKSIGHSPGFGGGGIVGVYGTAVYLAFLYGSGDDVNFLKLQRGTELLEWILDHWQGDNYQILINTGNNDESGLPSVDYVPIEERIYENQDQPIALLKIELAVRQRTTVQV